MEQTVNCVNINDIDYIILDEINIEGIKYIFLVNENDENDLLLRKVIIQNNEEYLDLLDNQEEIDKALVYYYNRHKN